MKDSPLFCVSISFFENTPLTDSVLSVLDSAMCGVLTAEAGELITDSVLCVSALCTVMTDKAGEMFSDSVLSVLVSVLC